MRLKNRAWQMDLGGFPQRAVTWLEALDSATLWRARKTRLETLADAAIALFGVLILRWSPYPIVLFLVASLWLGLLETLARWLLDRDRLARTVNESRDVDEALSIVRRERDGVEQSEPQRPLPGSLGVQLAIAIGFAAVFTGSLLYQLTHTVGLSLGEMLLDRLDMLVVMGGLLALHLYGLLMRLRQPDEHAPWLQPVSPVLDMILFVLLVFCWTVIAGIALKVEEIVGGDRQYIAATAFVCVGYGLVAWRAVHEIRDLRQLPRDLAWLAERAAATQRSGVRPRTSSG